MMRVRRAQRQTTLFGFAYSTLRFCRKEPFLATFSLIENRCVLEGEYEVTVESAARHEPRADRQP
jgi:hypothetical protein